MTSKSFVRGFATLSLMAVFVLAGMMSSSRQLRAEDHNNNGDNDKDRDNDNDNDSRIQIGFKVAPVPLNLHGKNRSLVGLGSYLVNAANDCNGCHNAGPGNNQYSPGGNPYFSQPMVVNPATYLGGGRSFGALVPGSANIISRNLTPDATGKPMGGDSFEEFLLIMRTGVDTDSLHPTCAGAVNSSCIPAPFDGSLLQVMPWTNVGKMNEHDLRAVYEYLSAIPCVAGPSAPDPRHHNC
jgi:hypothetical protein